jgi:hypothetical protein
MVVGFGDLFNNITLVRYNPDDTEQERMVVPLVYASKEDYVMRLEEDPDANKKIQLTLPRMSYEMTGMSYDSSRKQNTNIKNFAKTASGVVSQYNPVPYNFDFSLYLYVRNIEDGSQIFERIMSHFTPDYTIKLNLVPEMGIVKEVPIILNSTDIPVDFEGNRDRDTRIIIWTLNFTVKGFIFGAVSDAGLITHSITNVLTNITPADSVNFEMNLATGFGDYQSNEIVYQGYSHLTATATAKVESWDGEILKLYGINGNFISTKPIVGAVTNASYKYSSYNMDPVKLVQIDVTPNPPTANADSAYTYTTVIQEFGN